MKLDIERVEVWIAQTLHIALDTPADVTKAVKVLKKL